MLQLEGIWLLTLTRIMHSIRTDWDKQCTFQKANIRQQELIKKQDKHFILQNTQTTTENSIVL